MAYISTRAPKTNFETNVVVHLCRFYRDFDIKDLFRTIENGDPVVLDTGEEKLNDVKFKNFSKIFSDALEGSSVDFSFMSLESSLKIVNSIAKTGRMFFQLKNGKSLRFYIQDCQVKYSVHYDPSCSYDLYFNPWVNEKVNVDIRLGMISYLQPEPPEGFENTEGYQGA